MSTRIPAPAAFNVPMVGVEGRYDLAFSPIDEWDGIIDVTIGGIPMAWPVTRIERGADGRLNFSGMTADSQALWGDQFFFQLWLGPSPAIIEYWGDKVIVRVDSGVERN